MTDDLTINASGASEIEIGSVELDELFLDASGASQVSIEGTAGHLRADASGASNIALFGVEADEAEVDVSGASEAELTVLGRLEARASGASSVRYRGDPTVSSATSPARAPWSQRRGQRSSSITLRSAHLAERAEHGGENGIR